MSQIDINAFARTMELLSKKLDKEVLPAIQKKYADLATMAKAGALPKAREQINEAQIRQYVLDPLLASLGWNVSSPDEMLVEAPAEPDSKKGNRRFLDYLGQVSSSETEALLVVEAKRLSLDLPALEGSAPDSNSLCQALLAAAKKRRKVITKEWSEILNTLMDYAKRLDNSKVGVPLRMALMNGEWIVVFLNPKKTLIDKDIESNDILVAATIAGALSQAPDLYRNLSFRELSGSLPVQHYVNFDRLISNSGDELEASFAVEIDTGDLGRRPLMQLSESVAVRLTNGAWVRFYDGSKDPRILRDDEELADDMKDISARAVGLLSRLAEKRPLRLVAASSYEEQQTKQLSFPSTQLLAHEGTGRYVLYLGKESAPFRSPTDYEGCPFHQHSAAEADGMGQPDDPIRKRSIQPPVYFANGSQYHCAHKMAHALRQQRGCPIFYMEEQLCCQACSLKERCWPEGVSDLPCVQAEPEVIDLLTKYGPGKK